MNPSTTHQHPRDKDTTYTKIFVGGLPYHTTDKSLRNFFEVFGEIEEAVVITDRQTGKSRGYGFVTMADREAAERAVKDANPIIDGRKANVNLAYLGAKPRSNNTSNGIAFPVRGAYHPVLPNSQFGLASNPFMYATPASSSMFVSGPSILLPPSGHFFTDFATTFASPGPQGSPQPPLPASSHPHHHLPTNASSLAPSFLSHQAYNPYQAGSIGHPSSSNGSAGIPFTTHHHHHQPHTHSLPPAFITADGRMQ